MEYKIAFYGPNRRYAIQVWETTVGADFVNLAREIYQQDISLSIINCTLGTRVEENMVSGTYHALILTEEQALESDRFHQFCKLRVLTPWGLDGDGGGFFNDCIHPYPAATGYASDGITVTGITPVWQIDYEQVWLKWKAYGFFVTGIPGFIQGYVNPPF